MILSMFLGVMFLCLYLSQPNPKNDTIYGIIILSRIRRGLLSTLDIVSVNHYLWPDDSRLYSTIEHGGEVFLSYRIQTSKSGRLYQYIWIGNHRSVKFISPAEALCLLREDTNTAPRIHWQNHRLEVFSLLNGKLSENYLLLRPALMA